MWYDRGSIPCHITEISVLWVCFIVLTPPVGDIWYTKLAAIFLLVRVVIITIQIILCSFLWTFRQWIEINPSSSQSKCHVIASSRCHFNQIFGHSVIIIITGQIIYMKWQLTRSRSGCWGKEKAAPYTFGFMDEPTSLFGMVFRLHILQLFLLVLGSTRCFSLRIDMQSLHPHSTWSQFTESIEDMCCNEKHTCHWSNLSIIFEQLLSRKHISKVQVFLPLSLLLC